MSLMDIFRPAWKHNDKSIRATAIQKLTDRTILKDIAINDADSNMHAAAVKRIGEMRLSSGYSAVPIDAIRKLTDQTLLAQIAGDASTNSNVCLVAINTLSDEVLLAGIAENYRKISGYSYHYSDRNKKDAFERLRQAIFTRIACLRVAVIDDQSILKNIALSEDSVNGRAALDRITNQAVISEIVKTARNSTIRIAAVERITDATRIRDIAANASKMDTREAAIKKLDDQELLAEIALTDPAWQVRVLAISKLTDTAVLRDLAKTAGPNQVRTAAIGKIDDQMVLEELARTVGPDFIRMAAIQKMSNQALLGKLAREAGPDAVRVAAIQKLGNSDQTVFADLYKNDNSLAVREAAIMRLTDQAFLSQIAKNDPLRTSWEAYDRDNDQSYEVVSYPLRELAISKLTNRVTLNDIVLMNNCNFRLKEAAEQRLRSLGMHD